MQGTPDPVLGSDAVTGAIAVVVAIAVTALVLTARVSDRPPARLAVAAGLAYGVGSVALWFGVRVVAGRSPLSLWPSTGAFLLFVAISLAAFGVLAGLPVYLHARYGYVLPLLGLFVATALAAYVFLRVGGESDALFIYVFVVAPPAIAGELVGTLLEAGAREAITRFRPT